MTMFVMVDCHSIHKFAITFELDQIRMMNKRM